MPNSALDQWLELAPKPWPLRDNQKWHTYLSYRSIHRPWVLQLYDILKGLGYQVFLDQYVLTPGTNNFESLQDAVQQSSSALLVWASQTRDSEWMRREYEAFSNLLNRRKDFRFVIVTLDQARLPSFALDNAFIDFSEFREGPSGTPLLQLLWGLQGQPLPQRAIELGAEVDAETKESLALIRAARSVGQPLRLLELVAERQQRVAWLTSPSLLCQVVEALIALRENDRALLLIAECRRLFPQAIRPQQLHALALARSGKWQEAQLILTTLYEKGERDAETLGILARTWMDRYRAEKESSFLQRSRDLYLEAFRAAPDDSYAGINAASKSALLGDLTAASQYAKEVEALVGSIPTLGDYWRTATSAEVKLLQRDFAAAGLLYRAAVSQGPLAVGSHESTFQQAAQLLEHLNASEQDKSSVLSAFAHLSHAQTSQQGSSYQPNAVDRATAAQLLFHLVAMRRAEPELMSSLDPAKFWEAVRKVRPEATREDLAAVAREMAGTEGGNPSPLWMAWLETARSKDLDKLLQ
jgi:tetratricopeptide (TPR) repeat protein